MSEFVNITPQELTANPFRLIGSDWMLVTSANNSKGLACGKDYNTMTASWGGVGILWNKPVAFVFIRPQRHTFGFTEENSRLTLSFFDENYRSALTFCGRNSGRDYDKASECNLTPISDTNDSGRAVWFDEAKLVLTTKKLYADNIREDSFMANELLSNYKSGDFHRMYICEIESVLLKK